MKPTAALRQILEGPEVTMGIAAHDPLLARLVQNAGFKMVAVSGNAVAASYLGMPDMGFTNLNDIVDVSRRIAAAVDLPVLVDADTGFGNAMNILRTVGDFEQAGVAGIILEDQVDDKKCSMIEADHPVVPAEEHAVKIRADAGRVTIQTMHHAGAGELLAYAGQRSAISVQKVVHQRIDHRARSVASGGMHDDVMLLVDDDEVFVLIEHIEWEVFGVDLRTWRRRKNCCDVVACVQPCRGLGDSAVHRHRPLFDQSLQRRSTQERDAIDEVTVEPLTAVSRNLELHGDGLIVIALLRLVEAEQCLTINFAAGCDEVGATFVWMCL